MYDKNNIFAKILRGEIPCNKVYEDENVLAFNDIAPAAPKHILVVPKGEFVSFDDFVEKVGSTAVAAYFATIRKIAHQEGLGENGYRLISNHGRHASQAVPHFHFHLLGGKQMSGLLPGDELER